MVIITTYNEREPTYSARVRCTSQMLVSARHTVHTKQICRTYNLSTHLTRSVRALVCTRLKTAKRRESIPTYARQNCRTRRRTASVTRRAAGEKNEIGCKSSKNSSCSNNTITYNKDSEYIITFTSVRNTL